MDVTSAAQQNLSSIRQALSMASMQRAMGKDAQTVSKLIEGMEETTEAIERSVQPHRGSNLDVKI